MSFLSPWYLLGALAVAAPVWVHLIRHQQALPLPFASLMFFRRIPQHTVSRRRLKYLLLLAARCLLVLLLALAFARPFFPRAEAPVAMAPRARLFLLLVDRSLSMQYSDRAARAAAAARDILARMTGMDEAQVVGFDSDARVLNAPTRDRTTLRGLVESELRPTALPTNYAAALRTLEKLAQASKMPVAAFLISDFQKTGWTAGAGSPRLPSTATLELISVDDAARPNWAVSELRVARDTFQNRYPRRFQARVNGFHTPAAKKELVLTLNGRAVERRSVEIPAGGAATVVLESFELPPGPSRGELRLLPGDNLPQDDVRYFTLVRREPYRILYIAGSDSARELLYLREALAAGEDPPFAIDVRPPGDVGSDSLRASAAVVLSNLPALPGRFPARLKEYVEQGGGVLCILGDRSDWSSLARQMAGLLPATNGEKVYVRREAEQFVTLGDFRRDHFLFQPFSERAAGGLLSARFFGYFRLTADDSAVLARFSTGEPALVEKATGRGRVLLLASAPDNVWSDFPLHAGFVPLITQTMRYLTGLREEPAAYTVPATVALEQFRGPGGVSGDPKAAAYVVLNPAGRREDAEGTGESAGYARLRDLGFYEVRHHRLTEFLAANPDSRESDLTPLSSEDRALLARSSTVEPGVAEPAAAPTARERERQQNLWWALLLAAVVVAAGESVLGNNYLRGRAGIEAPRRERPT